MSRVGVVKFSLTSLEQLLDLPTTYHIRHVHEDNSLPFIVNLVIESPDFEDVAEGALPEYTILYNRQPNGYSVFAGVSK